MRRLGKKPLGTKGRKDERTKRQEAKRKADWDWSQCGMRQGLSPQSDILSRRVAHPCASHREPGTPMARKGAKGAKKASWNEEKALGRRSKDEGKRLGQEEKADCKDLRQCGMRQGPLPQSAVLARRVAHPCASRREDQDTDGTQRRKGRKGKNGYCVRGYCGRYRRTAAEPPSYTGGAHHRALRERHERIIIRRWRSADGADVRR
jgi:hypothetical protein